MARKNLPSGGVAGDGIEKNWHFVENQDFAALLKMHYTIKTMLIKVFY